MKVHSLAATKDLLLFFERTSYCVCLMEKLFYVYLASSKSHVLYTGITSNLDRRMWEHKNGFHEGFTKQYRCTRLVYYEAYNTPQRAIAREKQIKGWLRAKKIALIEQQNPTWEDLAAEKKAGPSTHAATAPTAGAANVNRGPRSG